MIPKETTEPPTYLRTVLYSDAHEERVRIDWQAGSRSAKHDHGASHGTTYVIEGEVEEVRDGVTTVYKAGEMFTEDPETIHMVGSQMGAVTFHINRPPVTGTMKTYE